MSCYKPGPSSKCDFSLHHKYRRSSTCVEWQIRDPHCCMMEFLLTQW